VKRLPVIAALAIGLLPATAGAQAGCEFTLGFEALRAAIPDKVGECLENSHYNPANGNMEQATTAWHGKGGLLVWRKQDNWTAFTDGTWTWINGPNGVQARSNEGPLLDWEVAGAAPTRSAAQETSWALHDDADKSFRYPAGWTSTIRSEANSYSAPGGDGRITYMAPFRLGSGAKAIDFMGRIISSLATNGAVELGEHRVDSINGFPAELQWYTAKTQPRWRGLLVAVQRGSRVHYFDVSASDASWPALEPIFNEVVRSYVPKGG
jgi:hypothetical protein